MGKIFDPAYPGIFQMGLRDVFRRGKRFGRGPWILIMVDHIWVFAGKNDDMIAHIPKWSEWYEPTLANVGKGHIKMVIERTD
jgi:hypothetical protein